MARDKEEGRDRESKWWWVLWQGEDKRRKEDINSGKNRTKKRRDTKGNDRKIKIMKEAFQKGRRHIQK